MSVLLRAACAVPLLGLAHTAGGTPQSLSDATDYQLTTWSIAEGLPQSSVNEIVQTQEGELWIATFGGLASFDGVRFRNSDSGSGADLPSLRITALSSAGAEGLWVATQDDGVMLFRDGKVVETTPGLPLGDEILVMSHDRTDRLWVRSSSGTIFTLENDTWVLRIKSRGTARYNSMCFDPRDGSLVVIDIDELIRYDERATQQETLRAPARILSLALDADEGVWLGLADGLARVVANEIVRVEIDPAIDDEVTALLPAGAGRIWVCTRAGVQLLLYDERGSVWSAQAPISGLPHDHLVRSMLLDREGNLWLGFSSHGLARLSPHYLSGISLLDQRRSVTALARGGDGAVWLAAECDGLGLIERHAAQGAAIELPLIGGLRPCVNSLLNDTRGRLWIGTQLGVLRRDGQQTSVLPIDLRGEPAGSLAEDLAGTFWISNAKGRLLQLDAQDRLLGDWTLGERIEMLSPAPDGSLWIAGKGVIWRLDSGEFTRFGAEQGVPRGSVRDLAHDSDGSIWLASYGGGLGRWHNGRVKLITRESGLVDVALSRILDDGLGRLWLLSNSGLIVAPREDFVAVAEGRQALVSPVLLGPEAGVNEANYGSPAGFRDADGSLVFGTIAGAVRVDPRRFPFNRIAPAVRIEQLTVDERPLDRQAPLEVPARARRLSFDFTAFALSVPERVRFRHCLIGFDARWIDIGTKRGATYTALPPGSYVLEVAARNEHGVWSDTPARLEFTVLRAWWQKLSVQVLALVALLAGAIMVHRLRVATVQRRGEVLLAATEGRRDAEARESRMREELAHVARVSTAGELATSLAHEVNQPLAAIVNNARAGRRLLERNPVESRELAEILGDIARQGERASEVIRRLRAFLRKHESERQAISLERLVRDTLPLLRRELEEHSVELRLELDSSLPLVQGDFVQLQQVLVNLVKNACEALAESSGARHISILCGARDGRAVLVVTDSGPGISSEVAERLFQPYVSTKPAGMGLGLAICRTIVEAHGGRLVAALERSHGAEFRVDLPLTTPP